MVVSISFNSNKQVNAVFFYLVGVAGETTSFKAYVVSSDWRRDNLQPESLWRVKIHKADQMSTFCFY